jgi:hypothetical protein
MSVSCLGSPAPATQPAILDPAVAAADLPRPTPEPRVRVLRYVQHPAFRNAPVPAERAWVLESRRSAPVPTVAVPVEPVAVPVEPAAPASVDPQIR